MFSGPILIIIIDKRRPVTHNWNRYTVSDNSEYTLNIFVNILLHLFMGQH